MDKELAKLLARLTALKGNIPDKHEVPQKYADEFNSILIGLEKISGETLGDFVIPDNEITPRIRIMGIGRTIYSDDKYCDKEYLLMKIDGVLGFFTLALQPDDAKEKFGFRVEEK